MAVLYLTGVLLDGSPATDLGVPANPRMALEVIQGTSNQLVCRITNPAGVPIAPVGDVVLTVKQKPQDEVALARLEGTWTPLLGPGTAVFSWTPTTMQYMSWGRYLYDVRVVNGGEVNMVIPASAFHLAPAV